MFVCLSVCSVWPAKRLGRSRPNLTHALMSTEGVFLARSMSRSFTMRAGLTEVRNTRNATPIERRSHYVRTTAAATPSERLQNAVELRGD